MLRRAAGATAARLPSRGILCAAPHRAAPLRLCALASSSAHAPPAAAASTSTSIGPLRPLPRWERVQGTLSSFDESSQLYGSAARWEAGREQRIA